MALKITRIIKFSSIKLEGSVKTYQNNLKTSRDKEGDIDQITS